jgi:hypothetical protein
MRPMRRPIISAFAVLAVAAFAPAVASARVAVEHPTGFATVNAHLIRGWWWLRTSNASATWTFSTNGVRSARSGTVYFQFSPLVTNHVNGGSGYARSIKVIIRGKSISPSVTRSSTTSASLYNPFRPTINEDTGGLGYQTYGFASVSSSIWRPSPLPPRQPTTYNPKQISVTIQWTSGYHVAVNRDTVQLAYATP